MGGEKSGVQGELSTGEQRERRWTMTQNKAEKQSKRKRGRTVSTSDVNYLQKHTDFDEEEIREGF